MKFQKYKKFCKLALLFVFTVSTQTFGQDTTSLVSTVESLTETVKLAPCKSEERFETVKKLFVQMGAKEEAVTVEKFNKDKISNIMVKVKGKSDETIVVGAHYDKIGDGGCGAIDNWTGISIIAHIYKSVKQIDTEKSYIFVAFDQEEEGLFGSEAMAKSIPKENREKYCAMVNFDSFGFSMPFILGNASSSKVTKLAKDFAKENNFKMSDVVIDGADADSSSFKSHNIPAITFSGLDNKWQNYLHSKNDQLDKINMTSVYIGYRFGLMFIAKLDSIGCKEIR